MFWFQTHGFRTDDNNKLITNPEIHTPIIHSLRTSTASLYHYCRISCWVAAEVVVLEVDLAELMVVSEVVLWRGCCMLVRVAVGEECGFWRLYNIYLVSCE